MAKIKHFRYGGLFHSTYEEIETDGNFAAWFLQNYKQMNGVEVFKGFNASYENAITHNEDELLKDGEFCVCYAPQDLGTALVIASVVFSVALIKATPEPELPANVNRQQESPNNQLSSRSNQARPLQRIPDIKGRVLSIPDVIQPTYSVYEGTPSKEVEYGYYCISRNRVSVSEVKDGDTPLELITGASARIYGPGGNPNNGVADIETITGPNTAPLNRPIYTPYRSNQVNGLVLSPDFADGFKSDFDADRFLGIRIFNAGIFGQVYEVGGLVELENFVVNVGAGDIDLSGQYEIGSFNDDRTWMFLIWDNPFQFFSDDVLPGATIKVVGVEQFTDWFYIGEPIDRLLFNVIAPNGMYKDDGTATLQQASVDYEFEYQEVDDQDQPIPGTTVLLSPITISGNNQQLVGNTLELPIVGPVKVRARAKRLTPRDFAFNGTVVDEIKWSDFYGLVELPDLELGNVTTIQTKTTATPLATSVKNRELNLIATEMLEPYIDENTQGPMAENTSAVQSFIRDSLDPVIGNRTEQELDIQGLLDLEQEINDYFNKPDNVLSQFSYTFDSTKITYQDYAQTVFNAINCIAYREGSIIKAVFEKPQEIPAMLFTHRSKIPGSETYTRNFNRAKIPDGVEFKYVDPNTNKTEIIYIPDDKSAVNPKKFEIAGIRNEEQARVRAFREYNKILNQKQTCDISVTAEGRYVKPQEMISIVKGTRTNTFDGEVLEQNGLILTLSQDVDFTNGPCSITLKNDDGTTENIPCTPGPLLPNQVILARAPQQSLRTNLTKRRTEFSFGNDSRLNSQRWIAQEINLSDKLNVNIKAINYSDEYYKDDIGERDFVITIDTNLGGLTQTSRFRNINGREYSIDWGDGSQPLQTIGTGVSQDFEYTYQQQGIYQIRVSGGVTYAALGVTQASALNTIRIDDFGTTPFTLMAAFARGCLNLGFVTDVPPDVSQVEDFNQAFYNTGTLGDANLNGWDVRNGTNFSLCFENSRFNGILSDWRPGEIASADQDRVNFERMFRLSDFNGDLNNWDMRVASNVRVMFDKSQFNQPLNNWRFRNTGTSLINNSMFDDSPFNQPVDEWNFWEFNAQSAFEFGESQPYDSANTEALLVALDNTPIPADRLVPLEIDIANSCLTPAALAALQSLQNKTLTNGNDAFDWRNAQPLCP